MRNPSRPRAGCDAGGVPAVSAHRAARSRAERSSRCRTSARQPPRCCSMPPALSTSCGLRRLSRRRRYARGTGCHRGAAAPPAAGTADGPRRLCRVGTGLASRAAPARTIQPKARSIESRRRPARIAEWRPGRGLALRCVRHAFRSDCSRRCRPRGARRTIATIRAGARRGSRRARSAAPLPDELEAEWDAAAEWWKDVSRAARRFVAAHLFGNWVAYHGSSLLTIVRVLKVGLVGSSGSEAARRSSGTIGSAGEPLHRGSPARRSAARPSVRHTRARARD